MKITTTHWLALVIAVGFALTYAFMNRYEFRDAGGYVCFDRWTGTLQQVRAKPAR